MFEHKGKLKSIAKSENEIDTVPIVADANILEINRKIRVLQAKVRPIEAEIHILKDQIADYMQNKAYLVDQDNVLLVEWKRNATSYNFNEKLFKECNPSEYKKYCELKLGSRVFRMK